MTIIRSIGVTTLVALMSAHRTAAEQYGRKDSRRGAKPEAAGSASFSGMPTDNSFTQETVDAIEDYLRRWPNRSNPSRSTESPPSYN